jgi:hypothetical protein
MSGSRGDCHANQISLFQKYSQQLNTNAQDYLGKENAPVRWGWYRGLAALLRPSGEQPELGRATPSLNIMIFSAVHYP